MDDTMFYEKALKTITTSKASLGPYNPPPPSRSPPVPYVSSSSDSEGTESIPLKRKRSQWIKEILSSSSSSSSSSSFTPVNKKPRQTIFMEIIHKASPTIAVPSSYSSPTASPTIIIPQNAIELLRDREKYANYCVKPTYPTVNDILVPGDRRRCVNLILAMCYKLKNEPCTPCYAVLVMDRYLSNTSGSVSPQSTPILALMCVSIAGKLVDLDPDSTPYGTLQYSKFVRACSISSKTQKEFSLLLESLERRILNTLGIEMYSIPCVMEYIDAGTPWVAKDDYRWTLALIICDVFFTFTNCTKYSQYEIAAGIVCLIETPDTSSKDKSLLYTTSHASEPMIKAIARGILQDVWMFASNKTKFSRMADDPFVGIKLRHRNLSKFIERIEVLHTAWNNLL